TSYEVESIDYNPPFPSTGGTQTSVNTDDVWSPVIDLPFDFCFFGEVYDSAQVGSNGMLTFDEYVSPGFCPYNLNGLQIPNVNFPVKNAIYGVFQDIDPSINNAFANPDINYQVLGTYPCRALVVSFNEVATWGTNCNSDPNVGAQTSQIVIYEVSNVIEVYVQRRVPCVGTWNGGGVVGIQNEAGTQAYAPPGRNTGAWTALTPEAWRFTPNGTANVEFAWYQGDAFYSADTQIEVCVTDDVTMTARATYTNCNGEEIVKESEVLLSIAEEIVVEDPLDLTACSTSGDVTFDLTESLTDIYEILDPTEYTFLFYSSEAAAIAGGTDNLPESYTTGTSQTIWVRIFENGADCAITKSFDLILTNTAPVFTITPDFSLCEGTTGTITLTSTQPDFSTFPIVWTNGTTTLPDTGSTITVTEGGTYTATVGGTGCTSTASTVVTIVPTPVIDDPADVTACDSYTLPALAAGAYYTGTGGTGELLAADAVITTTQDIYVYAQSGTTPNCVSENVFTVTIVPTPVVVTPGDQQECAVYELPALAVGNYYTQPGGLGTMLIAGDDITVTQTIYVYASNGTAPDNCFDEESFVVTINPGPIADQPVDVTACDSYELPALSADNAYYTEANGQGTLLTAGTAITSTQTIYVYASNAATPDCTDENTFIVTINPTPVVVDIDDVTACNTYTLPALTVGNYWTATGGTGTMLNAGDAVTSTQIIYIYAETATTPNCTDEESFTVTIVPTPVADAPADVTACGSYTLLPLTSGNYFTGAGGTGTALSAGDVISSTQQIYVYIAGVGTCFDENLFTVTIPTPVATTPGDQTACNSYVLPALAAGNYYTAAGGTGTMLSANDTVTTSQTIFVYVQSGTTPNCTAEASFTVTITTTPVIDDPADVTECVSYELPALAGGNYFTGTGGTGTQLSAGQTVSSTQTIYVYASNGGTCVAENSFVVTIVPLADFAIAEGCNGNDYVLEATFDQDPNYNKDNVSFVWTNASGAQLGTGATLTVTQQGQYFVTVTPAGTDCPITRDITVDNTSCMIQKGISPNNDGKNDNFELTGLGVKKLSIFNRYGQEVYSFGNYTNQWYGQGSNGDELPTGTYFYAIERTGGENKTGWIYINREEK
ncbi:MAG: gliding motility-associated C-terminal domain-containing protein, partial [Flavobacterium sp.]